MPQNLFLLSVDVIFFMTDNGTVYKVFSGMTRADTPFVVEQIQVFKVCVLLTNKRMLGRIQIFD